MTMMTTATIGGGSYHDEDPDDVPVFLEEGSTVGRSEKSGTTSVPVHSNHSQIKIANEETRYVFYLRIVLFLVLLLTTIFVSVAMFWYAQEKEKDEFEASFNDMAEKMVDAFRANAKRRVRAIESFAVTITSTAITEGQTWPNVTLPDWERRATYVLDLAEVVSILFFVIVTGEAKPAFESYAWDHQGWMQEGLALQGDMAKNEADEQESIEIIAKGYGESPNGTISPRITTVTPNGVEPATGDGPFAPMWQIAPVVPAQMAILYDTLSHPTRGHLMKTIMEHKSMLVSEAFDYSDPATARGKKAALNLFLNRRKAIGNSYQDGPVSDVYVPIFQDLDDDHPGFPSGNSSKSDVKERKVVGTLTAYLYWQAYFLNILSPTSNHEITAILSNTCGQNYTYSIRGPDATYIGPGDHHDTKFDGMEVTTGFNAVVNLPEDGIGSGCSYKVQVYPTQEMEDHFLTNTPWVIAVVIICTFLVTSGIFVLYDWLVQRRQEIVMTQAIKSTTVVQSLFPEQVRDRMETDLLQQHKHKGNSDDESIPDKPSSIIADLYPNATVLFADLAGFTQWSSCREPEHVFMLLETLYGAFDAIAKRRMVFKIETIGDCYMAVTGVPRPQEKHALTMARFASECIMKMDQLIHNKLVDQLGEETAQLRLRVGLNSGPVTAGVLRGERARYQLFGDTVNVAARMESLGVPGKIQATEATANLLIKAGKSSWVTERKDGVDAKGKGKLRTFWIQPPTSTGSCVSSDMSHSVMMIGNPLMIDNSAETPGTRIGDSSFSSATHEEGSDSVYDTTVSI